MRIRNKARIPCGVHAMAHPFDGAFWGDRCPPALQAQLAGLRRDRPAMLQQFAEAWARYVPQVAPGGDTAAWVDYFTDDAQFSALLVVMRGATALPAATPASA